MRRITLCKQARPSQKHPKRVVWLVRWREPGGRRVAKKIGDLASMTRRQADGIRRGLEDAFKNGTESAVPLKETSLSDFRDIYKARRATPVDGAAGASRRHKKFVLLTASTITDHDMTLRYLIQHFGPGRSLGSIDVNAADTFLVELGGGRLADARVKIQREYSLSEQTIRGHVRNCKAIFHWARVFDFVRQNPFDDFDGTPVPTEPNAEVSLDQFERLVSEAPGPGWAALFGLCRLAGLRRGEAIALTWGGRATDKHGRSHDVGIDFDARRLRLVAAKTRMHREVPVCPRLAELLQDAFDAAADGQATVCGLSENNLTRYAKRIATSAGLQPWPKFFQAMRSSCENDWKIEGVAEATYAAFLGHSPTVSRKHYTSPTDAEFAAISTSGHDLTTVSGSGGEKPL